MKKVLKIMLVIVLVIIAILAVHTLRNFVIIKDLQKKVKVYAESTNYSVISTNIYPDSSQISQSSVKTYRKGNNTVQILERITTDAEIATITTYSNGEYVHTYIDSAGEKIAKTTGNIVIMNSGINGYLYTENVWENFILTFRAKIRSGEHNGKECYIVKDIVSSMVLSSGIDFEMYFEKDTGLNVKYVEKYEKGNEYIQETEFQFDNVDDSIFVEPDISQYEIQEDVINN